MATPTTSMPQQHAAYRTSLSPARQEPLTTSTPTTHTRHASGPSASSVPSGQSSTPPIKAAANARAAAQAATQQSSQVQAQSQPAAQPQSAFPTSSKEREKERISLLLLINGELLQEILRLQADGKTGPSPAQAQPSPTQESVKDERDGVDGEAPKSKKVTAHPEFVESEAPAYHAAP